jgi:PAS domain S-box-containing protein
VLILEDNPRDAKLTVGVLQGGGYKLRFEITDSLEFFRERLEKGEYDVILADFNLRNWTALDALEILKRSGKDIPLIMVTGFLGDEAAAECIKRGAADFVLKDRPARLPNTVQRVLEEKRLRTENKRALETTSRLATIVESSDDAIIGKTLEGVITNWNKGAEKLYGYSAGEVLGQPISVLAPPERAEEVTQILARLKRGERLEHFESVRVRKDGSLVDVSLSIFPLTDSRGEVTGIASIARDVTERKRADQELHESEERYRSLVEAAPDVIYTVSAEDGSLTSLNPAFETLTGWSRAEWLGKPFVGMVHPDDLPVAVERFQKALRGEMHPPRELRVLCKSGEYLVGEFTSTQQVKDGKVVGQLAIARDITDRKRAEEALIEERYLLHTLMDNLPDAVYFKDRESHFTRINKADVKLFGLSGPAQAVGKTDFDFFTTEHAQEAYNDEQQIIRTGQPVVGKEEMETWPDGHVTWASTTKMPLRDAKGNIIGTFGVSRDVTERKRAEGELRASETRYRRLFEAARDGIFILDADSWEIRDVNPFLLNLLGFSRAELLGRKLWEIGPLRDVLLSKVDFEELQTREFIRYENLPLETREGKHVEVEFVSNVYISGDRKVIQCNIRDITERKRAEAEHVRLVTAIEQSAEAVLMTNTEGEIQYVNPAFTRITGYSRDEVLGQNPRILKSGKQDPAFYQQLWATILKGEIWHGELINRRKDGSLYSEQMSIAPVRSAGGEVTYFIATKQDVTEHKKLEQQLIQAQKMEAVGRLAGGVAHDFNNLLTIINGYAQLLIEPISPQDPRRGHLKEILTAGERAASLTRQLLAFSRRQVLEPRVLNLNSVLADVAKMLRRLIGEDVELVATLKPDLGRVKVDPGQIEQVIMNLAVNARDAMPQGGKLFVETSNVEIDANYARSHSPMMPGKYVMVAVSDTGCGMDLETQAHLFEPFFTTKEKGHGTGLGLATVYGIVKQSGGFIWVYSVPGRGSTFKIYLPVVEEALPTAEPAEVPAELAKGSETVLVVEDEGGVRSLVCEALASHGYKVLEAAGAASALEISEKYTEPIHLLLTDVVMPQTGGKELAKGFSTLHPETKVLYMSGYTDDAIVRHGILERGTSFLQKPFQPRALLLKIREVLKMKSGTQQ